jgi:4-amino-4-deoxy-L-arabinose transferase-like glycosyltransferase
MVATSLFVELLRTRPHLLFWLMAAIQAVLWTLVPALFFAAPPGNLPVVLAIGHEFQLGTEYGPPLAFWLAEIAFRLAGMFGVYLLSQICIVVSYWAVLALGRAIVGEVHAVIGVLLMAGIAVFSLPTPAFGPGILAAPLWALMLLHYWQATQRDEWVYWLALGLEAGLLLLTTYAGIILIGLLLAYSASSPSGRAQYGTVGPWIAGILVVAVLFPYLVWFELSGGSDLPDFATVITNLRRWGQITIALVIGHIGLAILVVLARGMFFRSDATPPAVSRPKAAPSARRFVYFFALVPMLSMILFALLTRRPENFIGTPLVVLSGLAVVIASGDRIKIEHQYLIGSVWAALLALPPLLVALVIVIQPWVWPLDLQVGRPAAAMGQFFADSFQRRTGRPLAIVAGDLPAASLVALAAPSRPSLYLASAAEFLPRLNRRDLDEKGAVILWPATDTAGRPPPEIARQFPDLVAEVPQGFPRRFEGRMAQTRVGWGMIRPRATGAPQAQ